MNNPITFPVTLEAFTAYQEQLAGQELDGTEKELIEALVSLLNYSHMAGQHQDRDEFSSILQGLDRRQTSNETAELEFLQACRRLVVYAWEQGRRAADGR